MRKINLPAGLCRRSLLFCCLVFLVSAQSGCVTQTTGQIDQSFEARGMANLLTTLKDGADFNSFDTLDGGDALSAIEDTAGSPTAHLIALSTRKLPEFSPTRPKVDTSSSWFHDPADHFVWEECEHCKNRGVLISSYYGKRKDPKRRGYRFHNGLDIRAARNSPILALKGGKVIRAERYGAYGLTVEVQQYDGLVARYAHMDKLLVSEGDEVDTATTVGELGSTGRVTGPHLHFELMENGKTIDPMLHLARAEQVVHCREQVQPALAVFEEIKSIVHTAKTVSR